LVVGVEETTRASVQLQNISCVLKVYFLSSLCKCIHVIVFYFF